MQARWIVASLAAVAVCCANGASAAPSSALKTTVLAVEHGEIGAFAQDGPRLAWTRPDRKCGGRVVLYDLRTRQRLSLEDAKGPSCRAKQLAYGIAIGGRRVVWESQTFASPVENSVDVVIAAADDRRNRVAGGFGVLCDPGVEENCPPLLVAGDGPTIVFGTPGGVSKIVGGRASRLFNVRPYPPLALAAAGAQVAALEDLYPDPGNYEPHWSPDGTRIAWNCFDDVCVMNADGGAKRDIARAGDWGYTAGAPRWSPDGTKLVYAFRRQEDGPSEVHVVNADGSVDRRLGAGLQPRWSPSGGKLSLLRTGDVWTIDADGSGAKPLSQNALAEDAEWSPDSMKLVAAGAGGLYVLQADGTGQTRILNQGASQPQWSPTGKQIAFENGDRVAVVNADGSDLRELADGANPVWSPEGKRLAFDNWRIFVVPSAGGRARTITPSGVYASSPSWSPDGSAIVFGDKNPEGPISRHTGGVYRVAPDGSGLKKLEPADRTGVKLRDVRQGGSTRSFIVHGDADAMALSTSFLAVLGRDPVTRATQLQLYRPRTGALVASVAIPPRTAPDLAVSSGGIAVFRVGRLIRAFDARTRAIRTIAIAHAPPIGLSIDGRRLAWAECRGRRSVVRAVVLPARLS